MTQSILQIKPSKKFESVFFIYKNVKTLPFNKFRAKLIVLDNLMN